MSFFNVIWLNLRRAIFSWRFVLYSILICLAMLAIGLSIKSSTLDVAGLLGATLGGTHGGTTLILATLPLMPYTLSFATEWEEQAVLPWVIRSGAQPYAIGKVVASVTSAFLTVFMSCVLFVIVMGFTMPLYQASYTGESYQILLDNNQLLTYFTMSITDYSLRALLFSALAFLISTLIPNKFVTLSAPVAFYFIASRLTNSAPYGFRVVDFVQGTYDIGSPATNLLLKFLITAGMTLIFSFGAVQLIKRRIKHV